MNSPEPALLGPAAVDSEIPKAPRYGPGAMSNAGWNAFSSLWTIAVSFLVAPLLIHTMGTDQYGVLLLFWSVTGILGLMGFGFGDATLRYMAHYFGNDDMVGVNRVLDATLSLYLVMSGLVCAVLFAGAFALTGLFAIPEGRDYEFESLLRLAGIIFALRAVSVIYGAVPMALQRYDISTKIAIAQSIVRTAGYVAIALAGFNVLHLVMWDVLMQVATVGAQAAVVRRLVPGVTLIPSFSFKGLREIAGFSVFTFLGYAFHMMHRESAKLILGLRLGPSPVAYLGTPDNVALRLHMLVASAGETLMPRFSANRDPQTARVLFVRGTWASLALSLVLLLPLAVLLPDLLRLWISPEFAAHSGAVGQLVTLSYISQGAYAPAAMFFRGTGRPSVPAVVVLFAGLGTLLGSLLLIPAHGLMGVGYAYILGSVPAFMGVAHCWYHVFGRSSTAGLSRVVGLPLVMGALAFGISFGMRAWLPEIGWLSLFALGGMFAVLSALLIVAADWTTGDADAPSKVFLAKVLKSRRVAEMTRHLALLRAR